MSSHGRSCLRVGADEAGLGRCNRGAAPSRERTTDWNGTGTRQQHGADDRFGESLETAERRSGEGRRGAGKAMVFHPPIRHDEANRGSGQPETGARKRLRRKVLHPEAPRRERRSRTTTTHGRPGAARRRDQQARRRACGQACTREARTSSLVRQETGERSEHDPSNGAEKSATPDTSLLGTENARGRQTCAVERPPMGAPETEREAPGIVTWEMQESARVAAFGQRPVS